MDNSRHKLHNANHPQNTKKGGFTLVELLVTVAIISVIGSIVFATLNNARTKADAAIILTHLRQIEKALYLLADDQSISEWWHEDELDGVGPADITALVADPNGLGQFLSSAPIPPQGTKYTYDNDDDTFSCGVLPWKGVNISARAMFNYDIFEQIDNALDNGDGPLCGRVGYSALSGSMYYKMGDQSGDY